MLSIIVDAHEGRRDVATVDVTGAYLKADMDDFVVMKFMDDSVDILCEMNPLHKRFIAVEKGIKELYIRLVKAIYGCVKSALLWYDLFNNTLNEMGFVYVDDNKISHVEPAVVTMIIKNRETFRQNDSDQREGTCVSRDEHTIH